MEQMSVLIEHWKRELVTVLVYYTFLVIIVNPKYES